LSRSEECEIAKPKIRFLPMPVLEAGPDVDGTAWFRTDGILPFRLIPASASSAQQELITCPLFAMFDVPVIAASQFSDDLGDGDGASGNRCSAALSDKSLDALFKPSAGTKRLYKIVIPPKISSVSPQQ